MSIAVLSASVLGLSVVGSVTPTLLTSSSELEHSHSHHSETLHWPEDTEQPPNYMHIPGPEFENYSMEHQWGERNKIFSKKKQEIIDKFKRQDQIWYSPDHELDSFGVDNQAVTLVIPTKFTNEEKNEVKQALKNHWCSDQKTDGYRTLYKRVWDAVCPPCNIFNAYRNSYYVWWRDYCNGKQSRYPSYWNKNWPPMSLDDAFGHMI